MYDEARRAVALVVVSDVSTKNKGEEQKGKRQKRQEKKHSTLFALFLPFKRFDMFVYRKAVQIPFTS